MPREDTEWSIDRWRGRVALVTGASAGIGRETAQLLARAGMKVAACARRADRLQQIAGSLPGADFLPIAADLRREADILSLFDQVRSAWGGVDVLVNNAGLGHRAPLASGSTEHWREMLEVNVLALSICTREAVQDMRRRGDDGHVIHVSSMAAHRVPLDTGMYSATKFAVRSLTESLRQELRELASGIRVTAISPGFVETEFAAHYNKSEQAAQEIYARFACLQPSDIAEAVRWVLAAPPHVQTHDILLRPRDQPN